MKKKTLKEGLNEGYAELNAKLIAALSNGDENRKSAEKWREFGEEKQKQFADLKKRLHDAEVENARLNGYLLRVQEDDVVREPLVKTVGPEGARMVPKRKHSSLENPAYDPTDFRSEDQRRYGSRDEKPKHWIAY